MKQGEKWIISLIVWHAFLIGCTSFFLAASGYPNRPIEMVIPFPPGGVVEIVERPFKDKVAKILGQPAVISFTAGAGGPITSSERK